MRVYLDNSVIGRLLDIKRGVKRKSKTLEEDMEVLSHLLHLSVENGIELCVSDDAGAEIEKLRSSMPDLTNALMATLRSFILLPVRHAAMYDDGHHYDFGATYAIDSRVDLLAQ